MAAYWPHSVCDTIVTIMTKCLGYHSVSPEALLITCSSSNVILLIIFIIIPHMQGLPMYLISQDGTQLMHFSGWGPVDAVSRTWKSVESGTVYANRDYPGKFIIWNLHKFPLSNSMSLFLFQVTIIREGYLSWSHHFISPTFEPLLWFINVLSISKWITSHWIVTIVLTDVFLLWPSIKESTTIKLAELVRMLLLETHI